VTVRRLLVGVAAVLVLTPVACGDEETDGPAVVRIGESSFTPRDLTVTVGERVTFVNRSQSPRSARDDSGGPIDVSPQPGPTKHDGSEVNRATRKGFATHALFSGERQAILFTVPAKYNYYSAFGDLSGTIEVVEQD
jgi:plastocyanin